jgi:hypothetical protein
MIILSNQVMSLMRLSVGRPRVRRADVEFETAVGEAEVDKNFLFGQTHFKFAPLESN